MFDTSVRDRAVAAERDQRERERAALFDRVVAALAAVREEYGIREAYLVGSLPTPHAWHRRADVDAAVSGCSAHLLDLMKALEDVSGRDVDVIDLDRHPAAHALRRRGYRVYG
jgi:predicted nucleotidyltransferase